MDADNLIADRPPVEMTSIARPQGASDVRPLLMRYLPLAILIGFVFLYRSQYYGSPDVNFDEPYYLVVGDRMLHGAIPFVDIWDRKPIGLFLLYAFARLFGGTGFLQYQLMFSAVAAATSAVLWLLAQRYVGRWSALGPALLYVLWLEPYFGGGGQPEVFNNLLFALSIWLMFGAKDSAEPARIARTGALVMAMMGCALQIKYSALPEGVFLGLSFLYLLHRSQKNIAFLINSALVYISIALTPTIIVALFYIYIGHFSDFFYANFVSIFYRMPLTPTQIRGYFEFGIYTSLPLIGGASIGWWRLRGMERAAGRDDHRFIGAWLLFSALSYVMIGNFYVHYFVPVTLPLVLLCTPLLAQGGLTLLVTLFLAIWPLHITGYWDGHQQALREASMAKLTTLVDRHLDGRCLFIYDGPVALYLTTQACIPTRYAYPDHLSNEIESRALGTDAAAEMRHILASRPGVIITSSVALAAVPNPVNTRLINAALRENYVEVGTITHKHRPISVYALRDSAAER